MNERRDLTRLILSLIDYMAGRADQATSDQNQQLTQNSTPMKRYVAGGSTTRRTFTRG